MAVLTLLPAKPVQSTPVSTILGSTAPSVKEYRESQRHVCILVTPCSHALVYTVEHLTQLLSYFRPFWNFDIPTNAIIYERLPVFAPPPHPDTELLRAQLVSKLRKTYQELCHSREGMALQDNRKT